MRLRAAILLFTVLTHLLAYSHAWAQDACPSNIGFESGDFSNWQCAAGTVNTSNGSLTHSPTPPLPGQHTMISSASYQQTDAYGGFPITPPNGSNNSILLGNAVGGNGTEQVAYTFKVPNTVADYSLIYYYAVVFFNPPNNHADWEQPKFSVKVFDVATGQKIVCASVDYTSSANIPGFNQSPVNPDVYYKTWTPVTINLSGYEGKTLRLEFTTNDCAKPNGRHFAYAYVDVNEDCASPIKGNTICPGVTDKLTLSAPQGYMEYAWYNADFTEKLGSDYQLTLQPLPAVNTGYAVKVTPYPDSGCPDTLFTVIKSSNDIINLQLPNTIMACSDVGVNLTAVALSSSNNPTLKYSYYLDEGMQVYVPNSRKILTNGTYYIKATAPSGCFDFKPIKIIINESPLLVITNPAPVCEPATIDLTKTALTLGSSNDIALSYWRDAKATVALPSPNAVAVGGTYYIKAISKNGCTAIKPVTVTIGKIPVFTVKDQAVCVQADLTSADVFGDNALKLDYTYWTDPECTIALQLPKAVKTDGKYYIKGTSSLGCFWIASVNVKIYPQPNLVIAKPLLIIPYPQTVDLVTAIVQMPGLTYSYWLDSAATRSLKNPEAVKRGGTYYIKAENASHCIEIRPVKVFVDAPPGSEVIAVNTFTPNGDGTNDRFNLIYNGQLNVNYFKIFNRYGELAFNTADINESWDGRKQGHDLPVGTYYWVVNGYDEYHNRSFTSSGSITLIR